MSNEVCRCGDCRFATAPKSNREAYIARGVVKCDKPGGIAFNRLVYLTDFCSYGQSRSGDRPQKGD